MTCEEFRRLVTSHNPLSCTRAEFSAVRNHRQSCRDCDVWLEDGAISEEELIAALPVDRQASVRIALDILAEAALVRAESDPESAYRGD